MSFNQLAVTVGIMASYPVDYGLSSSQNWRLMFGLAAVPAAALFAGMAFQHESPAWLVTHGREEEARAGLRRLREGDIEPEIAEIREASQRKSSYRELLAPAVRRLVAPGIMLAVFQQVTVSTRSSTTRRPCSPRPGSATRARCWPTSATASSTSA